MFAIHLFQEFLGVSSISAIIVLCSILSYGIYIAGIVAYNVYFHPLASFPGPKSRAAFYIPQFWGLLTGKDHSATKALHEKYGDTVRVAPDVLSFNNAQAWRDIYGHRPGKKEVPRDRKFFTGDGSGVADIIVSNETDHSRMRRLLNHAFSESALQEQEPLITSHFDLLLQKLHEKIQGPANGKVDMARWYNFTTFDIIGDLCFGESFDALKNEDYNFWIANIFKGVKIATFLLVVNAYSFLAVPLFAIAGLFPSLKAVQEKHENYSRDRTERRLNTVTDRRDITSYVLRYNDEKGMTRTEIKASFSIILLAGSETTATLLSGATFYLLKNPDALHKVTAEVRNAFSKAEHITFNAVARLPYLQACIQEGLRMYPPIPGIFPRRTGPDGDIINGRFIPGKISVGVHQWSTNTSSRNFKDPQQYIPERWLGDPRYADDDRAALQPFSLGARNCLGKNLAWAEMRSILARMLWNFDMELCPESENWNEQKVYMLWDKSMLNVKLTARKVM